MNQSLIRTSNIGHCLVVSISNCSQPGSHSSFTILKWNLNSNLHILLFLLRIQAFATLLQSLPHNTAHRYKRWPIVGPQEKQFILGLLILQLHYHKLPASCNHIECLDHLCPLKSQITTWIALYDGILTADVLNRHNIIPSSNASSVLQLQKIANHFLLHYPLAKEVWQYFLSLYCLRNFPSFVDALWHQWHHRRISSKICKEWNATKLVIL